MGQTLRYDPDGNLLSDGQRDYTWDAENRLVGITYPGLSGKQTTFAYDGLSRRTAIASTPVGGGGTVTTSYVWCGARICQARNASDAVTRGYYTEGEFVPGSPAQPYYYGPDQLGSVRRVFASASSAPAYGYDPYGNALQTTAPLTDFGYARMIYNADSGLYLTQYRAYDPNAGRWLSRDPLGEGSDPAGNLYAYVGGNPIGNIDPLGLASSDCPTFLGMPVTPNQYSAAMAGATVGAGVGIWGGVVGGAEAGAEIGLPFGGPIGGFFGGVGGGAIGGLIGAFGGVAAGAGLDAAGVGASQK